MAARSSFTLRQVTTVGGSVLQQDPTEFEDFDDSALQGSGFVQFPAEPIEGDSVLEVAAVDYTSTRLRWSISGAFVEEPEETPAPIEAVIVYDSFGEPQTIDSGVFVVAIDATNTSGEFVHTNLPEGQWAYYSLFVKYASTTTRSWYERVASVSTLSPKNWGSLELLWSKVPMHYRANDDETNNPLPLSSPLYGSGPLRRMLDVFAFDIDRVRTLVNFQMKSKDPVIATPEVLDTLCEELGIPITSEVLGTSRLRNIIKDIWFLRNNKGTYNGTIRWLTAITGCTCRIVPTGHTEVPLDDPRFEQEVLVTDEAPDTGWVFDASTDPEEYVLTSVVGGGLTVQRVSGSAASLCILTTKVTESYATILSPYLDTLSPDVGYVLGFYFSDQLIKPSDFVLLEEDGFVYTEEAPEGFLSAPSSVEDDWYEAPYFTNAYGNGKHELAEVYVHIVLVFTDVGEVTLDNVKLETNVQFPYRIDILSQRANLCRDPQFAFGVNETESFWNISGGDSYSVSNKTLSTEVENNSDVFIQTSVDNETFIPFELGIPYYFSVTDGYDNISRVEIHSVSYGLISSALSPISVVPYANGAFRKTWEVGRDLEPPYLPRKIGDCYLSIVIELPEGGQASIREPLLEAVNPSGVYFDGDNINGGWLAGPDASAGVADYRWGPGGRHSDFSYYGNDYQRTVNVTTRLLDRLIPVIDSDIQIADLLNFNVLYGE